MSIWGRLTGENLRDLDIVNLSSEIEREAKIITINSLKYIRLRFRDCGDLITLLKPLPTELIFKNGDFITAGPSGFGQKIFGQVHKKHHIARVLTDVTDVNQFQTMQFENKTAVLLPVIMS